MQQDRTSLWTVYVKDDEAPAGRIGGYFASRDECWAFIYGWDGWLGLPMGCGADVLAPNGDWHDELPHAPGSGRWVPVARIA